MKATASSNNQNNAITKEATSRYPSAHESASNYERPIDRDQTSAVITRNTASASAENTAKHDPAPHLATEDLSGTHGHNRATDQTTPLSNKGRIATDAHTNNHDAKRTQAATAEAIGQTETKSSSGQNVQKGNNQDDLSATNQATTTGAPRRSPRSERPNGFRCVGTAKVEKEED